MMTTAEKMAMARTSRCVVLLMGALLLIIRRGSRFAGVIRSYVLAMLPLPLLHELVSQRAPSVFDLALENEAL